jgi:glycosyltransferase involved in cell wall biosynthesis
MYKEKPLVSIVMNCFNGERFLKEAIDSVYSQTYENWEIIFWDNCSSDNSALIAKSYDQKLKYFRSEKTTLLGVARDMAIKKANGKFVAFLDTDDLYLPDKLEIQINEMKLNQSVLSYGSWIEINEFGNKVKKHKLPEEMGNFFEQLLFRYNVNFQTLMIDNDFLKKSNINFDESLTFSPDFSFVMQFALLDKISSIEEYLAKYRVHSESMTSHRIKDKYQDYIHTIKILEEKGADEMYPRFKLLSLAVLSRMKYRDNLKSNNYFFAYLHLICYSFYRARIAFIN